MKCNATFFPLLLAVSLLGFIAVDPARAGSIINIAGGVTSVAKGGTGTVDFLITADSPVNLVSFNLQLQINVTTGNLISDLAFLPNANFSTAQQAVFDRPTYVFFGNSFQQDPFPTGVGAASIWTDPFAPYTTINGGDFNSGITGYTTLSATPYLLVSVGFSLNAGAPLPSSFTISIESADFADDGSTPIDGYTSTAAVVNATSQLAAVPEPASMSLLSIGGLGMAIYGAYRQRRKKHL